jgi:hypothetical protein
MLLIKSGKMQNLDKKQQKKNDMSVKWELFGEGNQ